MTPLGLTLILLAVAGYFAWVHPRTSRYRLLRRGVLLLALVLVPLSGYGAWRHVRGQHALAVHVTPYPEAVDALASPDNAVRFPRVDGTWILETKARPEAVIRFYQDPENRRGWEIAKQTDETLILKSGERTLYVWASIQRPGTTTIVYQVNPVD